MARTPLTCSVITPEAKVFEAQVDEVVVPAHDGEVGIRRDRAPLVCLLGAGRLKVRVGEREECWFIDSGFAQVLDNRVVVLTRTAQRPEELSAEEARAALAALPKLAPPDEEGLRRRERLQAAARARIRMASR